MVRHWYLLWHGSFTASQLAPVKPVLQVLQPRTLSQLAAFGQLHVCAQFKPYVFEGQALIELLVIQEKISINFKSYNTNIGMSFYRGLIFFLLDNCIQNQVFYLCKYLNNHLFVYHIHLHLN